MNSAIQQPHSLHENIVHTTENRPYSMHYTKVPSQNTCALYLHWHAEYEFFYVTEGAITFILNQSRTGTHYSTVYITSSQKRV